MTPVVPVYDPLLRQPGRRMTDDRLFQRLNAIRPLQANERRVTLDSRDRQRLTPGSRVSIPRQRQQRRLPTVRVVQEVEATDDPLLLLIRWRRDGRLPAATPVQPGTLVRVVAG